MLPVLSAFVGCGGSSVPGGSLLLISERDGAPTTWVALADGSPPRRFAADVPGGVFPADPDPRGTHALLTSAEDSDRGHRETSWLAPLDGGPALQLGRPAGVIRNPCWSPDGNWIVFESDAQSFRDLYRIDRDGGGYVRLTDAPHGSFEPAVSPDGATILFGTSRDGNAEVYAMHADGTAPVRLTSGPTDDVHPGWSPDGKTVTWITHREGMPRVWRMAPDGSDPRALRADERRLVDLDFAWSPDGSRIAVVSQSGPKEVEITVIDPSSGKTVATIDGPGPDEHPSWSPDGRWLAFTATRDGDAEVFLASADGKTIRPLTTGEGSEWLPRWQNAPR